MNPPADDDAPARIGWLRAILTATVIVAVGIVVCVIIPNWMLTKIHSIHRAQRVAIATAIFFVGLFAIAWLLRKLQKWHLL